MQRTHYDNLQVARNASDIVIRAAYKTLIQKWHPDKHAGNKDKAERIIKIVNEAYRVLSDPDLRRKHDEWIARREAQADDNQRSNCTEYERNNKDEKVDSKKTSPKTDVQSEKICPKCKYQRQPSDDNPEWQCPSCGVAYIKVEKAGATISNRGKPLATVDSFHLFENCFYFNNVCYSFNEIRNVAGSRFINRINAVPMMKYTFFKLALESGQEIYIDEDKTFLNKRRHDTILQILSYLRKATFETRSKKLIQELRDKGFLVLHRPIDENDNSATIMLDKRGIISTDSHTIDLKKARASGTLSLGTMRSAPLGSSYETEPSEVAVSLKKPHLGGYLPKDSLKFIPNVHDVDVSMAFLDWVSSPGNYID